MTHQIEGQAQRLIAERINLIQQIEQQVVGMLALYVAEKNLPATSRLVPGSTILTWDDEPTNEQ